MQTVYLDNYGFVPDIIGTSCANSIRLKDVEFRVPCGKCLPCQKKRRSEWSLRLEHEYLFSDSAFFITLTYNDVHIPRTKEGYQTLFKRDLQLYIKRLRNEHAKNLKIYSKELNTKVSAKGLRYYAVGEYGHKTRRPHYHLILFNYDIKNLAPLTSKWSKGFVDVGTVNASSINYVTKYMFKQFNRKTDKRTPPFSLMSKKPIIGYDYIINYGVHHIESECLEVRDMNGRVRRLPKAYLRRLFTNKEDRLEVSKKSYEKHIQEKLEQFEEKIEKYHDGKVLEYHISKDADLKRHRDAINNNEIL